MNRTSLSCRAGHVACLAGLLTVCSAHGQAWTDFTHAGNRHLDPAMSSPDVFIGIPQLLQGSGEAFVLRPTLVVLMDFSDMTHRAVHTEQFWRDLVFGDPRPGVRPSVRTIMHESSNGRLTLTPATAGDQYDGSMDGMVGWAASTQTAQQLTDVGAKRAEGIIVADPVFDYWRYDANRDGIVTTDELLIIVVFADNTTSYYTDPTEDQHLNHPQLPNSVPRPGGNTRRTVPAQVPVDQDTGHPVSVYQHIAGVGEIAHVEVVAHEIGHSTLGLGDLYEIDRSAATWTQTSDGYTFQGVWYPPAPGGYSLMSNYFVDFVCHLDPWAKIHLGFIKPKVITHDGTYTLHDAEPERLYVTQDGEPEAMIIADPRRPTGLAEYYILENRNHPQLPDRGLAVWLVKEDPFNLRKVVRLIRRGGHWAGDGDALWDGTDSTQGYDLTMISAPRNTNWTDGTASGIEITSISAAGPAMTFHVRLPSVFVKSTASTPEDGTADHPFNTVAEGVAAISEPPRTIRLAPGSYLEALTMTVPCTLTTWGGGNAMIGP